jgi:AraC-like DNA-binding protein
LLQQLAQHPNVKRPRSRFSLVEHAWHLAELEREGFQHRIERLLREDAPQLADFDGDRLATERRYVERDLHEGVRRFQVARKETDALLARVQGAEWLRAGWQDKVGRVVLREMPARIAAHDRAHALELAELLPRDEVLRVELQRFAQAQPVEVASPCHGARAAGPFIAPAVLDAPSSPSLSRVASELHVSRRTLQRRLKDAGLTLRCLVSEVRLSVAFDSLCRGKTTDRAAMEAGLSDRTALSRALKRWTGASPGALRSRC